MKSLLITLVVILFLGKASFSQGDRVWNESYYFDAQLSDNASIWLDAHYDFKSNLINNQTLGKAFSDEGLTKENTAYAMDWEAAKPLTLKSGFQSNFSYRSALRNKWRYTINVGTSEQFYGNTTSDLIQLLLRGNAPFEDRIMELGATDFRYMSSQHIGVGAENSFENGVFGASINLQKIGRLQMATVESGSVLYTAPYGTYIEGNVDYEYLFTDTSQNLASAWYGTGVYANFYYLYSKQDARVRFYAGLNNVGLMLFSGINQTSGKDSIYIDGFDLNDLNNVNSALENPDPTNIDSLVSSERANPSLTRSQLSSIDLRAQFKLKEKLKLGIETRIYTSLLPLETRIGLNIQMKDWLVIEPTISAFGISAISPGVSMSISAKEKLQLVVRTEQFLNLLVPTKSTSQYLYIGGQIFF